MCSPEKHGPLGNYSVSDLLKHKLQSSEGWEGLEKSAKPRA